MAALRRRHHGSSKRLPSSNNPYSGRGLDTFALVSAELAAKREQLSAEIDTPLSLVRFAIGSHSRWVPIVISPSSNKKQEPQPKKTLADGANTALAFSSTTHQSQAHDDGSDHESVVAIAEENKSYGTRTAGRAAKPASPRLNVAAAMARLLVLLKLHNKALIKGPAEIADGNPLKQNGAHSAALAPPSKGAQLLPAMSNALTGLDSSTEVLPTISPLRTAPRPLSQDIEEVQTDSTELGSKNSQAVLSSLGPTKQRSRFATKFMREGCHRRKESSSAPSTPRDSRQPKFLSAGDIRKKALLSKHGNALMVDGSDANSSANASGSTPQHVNHAKTSRRSCPFTGRGTQMDGKGAGLAPNTIISAAHLDTKPTMRKSPLSRGGSSAASTVEMGMPSQKMLQKERAENLGRGLTYVGPIIVLVGLMTSYVTAIVGVVCWWYALPGLRKAVGHKPFVQSHSHMHNGNASTVLQMQHPRAQAAPSDSRAAIKKKLPVTQVGSGKYDMQSSQYKKKVIMDGLLHRA